MDTRKPDAFKNAFRGKDGQVEREMPRKNKPRRIVEDEMCGNLAVFDEAVGPDPKKAKDRRRADDGRFGGRRGEVEPG